MRRQTFRLEITQPFTMVTPHLNRNHDDDDCRSKKDVLITLRERPQETLS